MMQSLRARLCIVVPTVCVLWLWAATPAAAQVFTWNDPTTGVWSVGTNWAGGTAPPSAPATELVFGATGANSYTATNDIANPFILGRLTLNNTGTGTITIDATGAGGAISFGGAAPELVNLGTGAVTISTPVNLAANTLFTGAGTGTVTLGGTVNDGGGGFGITSTAAGTFVFNAAGTSNINFLRLASGTTNITNGAWSLAAVGIDAATGAFVAGTTSGQTAAFTLSGGADLTSPGGNVLFGGVAGSTGNGTITGAGTTVTATSAVANTGRFVVGESGSSSVTISGGAVVTSRIGAIGRLAGSSGTVVVDGAGSQWAITAQLTIGQGGNGSLSVLNGATVTSAGNAFAGVNAGVTGTVIVSGAGSALTLTGATALILGGGATPGGTGNLTLSAGATITTPNITFGQNTGATSTSVIDGATLTVGNQLVVALSGTGNLTVQNGGVVNLLAGPTSSAFVGVTATGVGTLTVTGSGSSFTVTGANFLVVGGGATPGGQGNLNVLAGGTVTAPNVNFGQNAGATSTSVVDGGTLNATTQLNISQGGAASLTVQNGGLVAVGGDTTVGTVTGVTGTLTVQGTGLMTVGANTFVGTAAGGAGTVTVTGAGSALTGVGQLQLGGSGTTPGGTGILNVASGASASAGGLLALFAGGTANVNNAALSVGGLADGTATSVGNVALSNGGALTISDGLGLTYSGVISGAGSVTKAGAGIQTLTGTNTYTGNTNVNAGTLTLSGTGSIAASPTITVANGATLDVGGVTGGFTLASGQALRGGGTVTGGATAAAGSTVAPGTPAGTDDLVFNGNLTLQPGSTLAIRINGNVAVTTYDQVVVPAGTVNVTGSTLTLIGTFVPSPTDVLTVLLNTANNPIVGTFANPPVPGDPMGRQDFGQYYANISYVGSNGMTIGGNDIVIFNIVPVPEPGTVLGVAALAGLGVVGLRRRPARRAA